jgi:hypothetical protein
MILWKTVGYSGYLDTQMTASLSHNRLFGRSWAIASAATAQSADSTTKAARLEASEVC